MSEDDNKINLSKNEESSVKDLKVALEQSILETSEIIESLIYTIELKIKDEDIRKSTKIKNRQHILRF